MKICLIEDLFAMMKMSNKMNMSRLLRHFFENSDH